MSTLTGRMGEHFGRWLQSRREALGLSLRNLADAADCTHTAVAKIERGQFEPSDDLRCRLATAVGASEIEATVATFPDRFSEDERPLLKRWLSDGAQASQG